jgi:hypothetical protein
MSTKPIVQKLQIKSGEKILFLNPPEDYFSYIGDFPENITIVEALEDELDFVQVFVKNKKELEEYLPKIIPKVKTKGKIWISYYKGSSKYATDIHRDTINEYALSLNLKGVFIISINDDWSALRVKKLE